MVSLTDSFLGQSILHNAKWHHNFKFLEFCNYLYLITRYLLFLFNLKMNVPDVVANQTNKAVSCIHFSKLLELERKKNTGLGSYKQRPKERKLKNMAIFLSFFLTIILTCSRSRSATVLSDKNIYNTKISWNKRAKNVQFLPSLLFFPSSLSRSFT